MISKSLQTDESMSSFEEIIERKNKKILELEEKLKQAYIKIQKLTQPKRFKIYENEPSEDIQVTSKDISFHIKQPLDTAHIAHFNDSSASKTKTGLNSSEFQGFIRKNSENYRKNSIPNPFLSNINTKSSSNPSNLYGYLDEMIFSSTSDKSSWKNTIASLRNDPKLLSSTLKSRNIPKFRENPGKFIKKQESKIPDPRKNPHRSFSASIERNLPQIDWSQTILDSYASKSFLEFNFLRDQSMLSPYQIEDLLMQIPITENWEQVYIKGVKTLDKLTQELMLPKGYFLIPPKSSEHLENVLQECSKLFRTRALVMKILSLIHKREDLLLNIMRYEREDQKLRKTYVLLMQISQDILQTIGFLSQAGLFLAEFVYLGEDYSQKILQDDDNIKELFPGLKKIEEN